MDNKIPIYPLSATVAKVDRKGEPMNTRSPILPHVQSPWKPLMLGSFPAVMQSCVVATANFHLYAVAWLDDEGKGWCTGPDAALVPFVPRWWVPLPEPPKFTGEQHEELQAIAEADHPA